MAHTDPNHPPRHTAAHDPFHGGGLVPTRAGPVEEHPERHEHTDVPTRPLKLFFIITLVLAVLIHIGLYVLFGAFDQDEQERDSKERQRSALARSREEKLPPEPRLQGVPSLHEKTPREDMELMRIENDRLLTGYGLSADGKQARIPVELAMKQALEKKVFKTNATSGLSSPTTRPAANNRSGNAQQR